MVKDSNCSLNLEQDIRLILQRLSSSLFLHVYTPTYTNLFYVYEAMMTLSFKNWFLFYLLNIQINGSLTLGSAVLLRVTSVSQLFDVGPVHILQLIVTYVDLFEVTPNIR